MQPEKRQERGERERKNINFEVGKRPQKSLESAFKVQCMNSAMKKLAYLGRATAVKAGDACSDFK